MSKHYHQNRAEQIDNKANGIAPFRYEKIPNQISESMKPEDIQAKMAEDDRSIQLRAYQIYREKGGAALDNWLEAERILRKKG